MKKILLLLSLITINACANLDTQVENSENAQVLARVNDFPTRDRVDYVLECVAKHGGLSYINQYACGCKIDKIAEQLSFEEFDAARTFAQMQKTPGEQGAAFINDKGEYQVIAAPKVKAVDSTGAGDAFMTAFVMGDKNIPKEELLKAYRDKVAKDIREAPKKYLGTKLSEEKTKEFVNNDTQRLTGKINFPKQERTNTAVYEVLYSPYPTYLDMAYDITLRSEYLQQMNDMVVPFMTRTGGINSFMLKKDGHKYEAFIQSNFNLETNASSLNDQERIFTTKVQIKVLGYLLGEDKNEQQPKVVVRETAAKFRFQRERTIIGDINENLKKEGFYRS